MSLVRTIKLTRAMELDALRKVYESQPRILFLTPGQRERIARVSKERRAARGGVGPHAPVPSV